MSDSDLSGRRTVAFVGAYADGDQQGGIHAFSVEAGGERLVPLGRVTTPQQAGYLVYRSETRTLYAVDERKTDGRGPVQAPAAVHAFAVAPEGELTPLGSCPALGAFPTYLALAENPARLLSVSHGSFDHVERVVRDADGWHTEYVYDDSTVVMYNLEDDGRVGEIVDVQVLEGHGLDPNGSPQAGGHGQASAHAHSAAVDPSGRYVLVADKATDQIHVYTLDESNLTLLSTYQAAPETGPRHLVFDASGRRVFATYEFSSEVVSFGFDVHSGSLTMLDAVATVFPYPGRINEPADIRVHPSGSTVYVNNRGEDSLAWFGVSDAGALVRRGHVQLAASVHPGLAARSFAIAPDGDFLLLADRPAGLVRSYAVSAEGDGALEPVGEAAVPGAAFVAIITFDAPRGDAG
ncbi:lactonase family protein [Microbacterium sp. B2969]|uniref:Lactonase family protein n=1 Tax=Microbacterium alkaliflavum TaxID=3248839 RepID=A0ABW7QE90_9MICO